jgi:hypothetical protein
MNADEFYRCLPGHWPRENRLHWGLDVMFREDGALVTRDHAPENLHSLRKTALLLLRTAPMPENHITRMSGSKRRVAASISAEYMFSLLCGMSMLLLWTGPPVD